MKEKENVFISPIKDSDIASNELPINSDKSIANKVDILLE